MPIRYVGGRGAYGQLQPGSVNRSELADEVVASANAASHNVLRDRVRQGKGGVVGTGGKIAVALRIDHGVDQFLSTIWPLLKARGMPCSLNVNPSSLDGTVDNQDPTTTSWTTLFNTHREGFEVWSHCMTHLDPAVTGNSLEYEIADSKTAIESHGFVVNGIAGPGITPCLTPDYSGNFNPATSWTSHVGQLYLANYGLIEAAGSSSGGAMRFLPTNGCYDLGHYTLDTMTQAQAQTQLDAAIASGTSIEFMMHPRFIVLGGVTMTVSALTGFLDYLQTKRNAGLVEVLTTSGLAFADDGTTKRANLLQDSSFETQASLTTSTTPWKLVGTGGTAINSDGGKTGSKYLHIPAAAGTQVTTQTNVWLYNLTANGQTWICEAWARCIGSDTAARINLVDTSDSSKFFSSNTIPLTVAGGWTKIRIPFTIPKNITGGITINLFRGTGSGDVDFDDVMILAV
jgi:hypothetical protein